MKGKINVYTCPKGHGTITRDADEGVTPMMIRCQTYGCAQEFRKIVMILIIMILSSFAFGQSEVPDDLPFTDCAGEIILSSDPPQRKICEGNHISCEHELESRKHPSKLNANYTCIPRLSFPGDACCIHGYQLGVKTPKAPITYRGDTTHAIRAIKFGTATFNARFPGAPTGEYIIYKNGDYYVVNNGKTTKLLIADRVYWRGNKLYYHPDHKQHEEHIKTDR